MWMWCEWGFEQALPSRTLPVDESSWAGEVGLCCNVFTVTTVVPCVSHLPKGAGSSAERGNSRCMSHHQRVEQVAATMFTRYRRATTVSAPVSVEAPDTLVSSLADTSISVNVTSAGFYLPSASAVTTVSELFRPCSPADPTPDTPTITRILVRFHTYINWILWM